jgi:hypothetical protein
LLMSRTTLCSTLLSLGLGVSAFTQSIGKKEGF